MNSVRMHFNKPQLRSLAVDAPSEILIAGRGTGKTVGVLARKSAHRYLNGLPRSTGVILNSTYTQAFTRTLAELKRGWTMLGYTEGIHYIVGKRPPEKWQKMWKWKPPFAPPDNYKYVISWWNGSCAKLVSQAYAGSANGINIDWIIGDELKFIDERKLKTELLPANRGVNPAFKGNPYHHGQTYTTDMPVGTAGRWIFDWAEGMDGERVRKILQLQKVIYDIKKLATRSKSNSFQATAKKQINILEEEINELRFGLLYYHTASTLDNIHAFGVEAIKQRIRDDSIFDFDTQILNLKPGRLEDGFYPDFNEETHGYFMESESYFDRLDYNSPDMILDSRKDTDVDINSALHIGMDYNRAIHPISVGQVTPTKIKSLKGIHVLYPLKLKEAVKAFADYYRHHKRKVVYYWFDHTAIGEMSGETTIADDVITILTQNGWTVIPMYIGQQPGHEERYRMWGDLLTVSGKYSRVYEINRENCDKLILSKSLAPAEERKNGFGKDKSSEKDPSVPAEEATHYSDAEDTWVFGVLESGLYTGSETRGTGGIITS